MVIDWLTHISNHTSNILVSAYEIIQKYSDIIKKDN